MEGKNDNEINDDKFVRKKSRSNWDGKGGIMLQSKKGEKKKREKMRKNGNERKI